MTSSVQKAIAKAVTVSFNFWYSGYGLTNELKKYFNNSEIVTIKTLISTVSDTFMPGFFNCDAKYHIPSGELTLRSATKTIFLCMEKLSEGVYVLSEVPLFVPSMQEEGRSAGAKRFSWWMKNLKTDFEVPFTTTGNADVIRVRDAMKIQFSRAQDSLDKRYAGIAGYLSRPVNDVAYEIERTLDQILDYGVLSELKKVTDNRTVLRVRLAMAFGEEPSCRRLAVIVVSAAVGGSKTPEAATSVVLTMNINETKRSGYVEH